MKDEVVTEEPDTEIVETEDLGRWQHGRILSRKRFVRRNLPEGEQIDSVH